MTTDPNRWPVRDPDRWILFGLVVFFVLLFVFAWGVLTWAGLPEGW